MSLSLRSVRYFIAVAESESVTRVLECGGNRKTHRYNVIWSQQSAPPSDITGGSSA